MKVIGMVDVGFVRAAIAQLDASPRAHVRIKAPAVADLVRRLANQYGATAALRTYWYDGQYDPSDSRYASQRRYLEAVGAIPGIQVRTGQLVERVPEWHQSLERALCRVGIDPRQFAQHFQTGPELTQKGVDTLMVLDLVLLAQRHAYDVAVLMAADADLAEAVRVAQRHGVKVVLACVPGHRPAAALRLLADDVVELTAQQVLSLSLRQNSGHRPGPTGSRPVTG